MTIEGCHTPPGELRKGNDPASPAPVYNGGSFSYSEMPGQYPTDPETGQPYPLMVFGLANGLIIDGNHNHHHTHFHRSAPELEGRLPLKDLNNRLLNSQNFRINRVAGIALRVSRVCLTNEIIHAMAHRQCPKGPKLPQSMQDKYTLLVKNLANVIPHSAYDPTAPEASRIRHMSTDVRERQTGPHWVHPERYSFGRPEGYQLHMIAQFLSYYATLQNIRQVDGLKKEEFLLTSLPERKMELGKSILKSAVAVAIDPLQQAYQDFKRKGLIQAGARDRNDSLFDIVWSYTEPALKTGVDMLTGKLAA